MYDLCVIGGGASGILASILANKRNLKVCLIEANDRVGKKLLATGNGKCNLSNADIDVKYYNTDKINGILKAFGSSECVELFNELGLYTRVKSGRIYPFSEMSSSVLNVLIANLKGVEIKLNTVCREINPISGGYEIITASGSLRCKNVCVATGSNASFGRSSLGLLGNLGHKIISPFPSLCPITVVDTDKIKGLQGVRTAAKLTLIADEKIIYSERGELMFKKDSLSGIVAFGIMAKMSRLRLKNAVISIDFLYELSAEEYKKVISDNNLFENGLFHKNLVALLKTYGKDSVRDYKIRVKANNDLSQAQVVSGGYDLNQFDLNTMQSLLHKGCYAIGEAVDVDGDCGGYNLHWAWASAVAMINGILGERNVAEDK